MSGSVIDIPALDMLRYDQFTPTRHSWTSEMGSIDAAGDFAEKDPNTKSVINGINVLD